MFLTVVVIGHGCWDWPKGSAKRKGHKEISNIIVVISFSNIITVT